MADVCEAIFISTYNNKRTGCTVKDLRTGTDLMRYKGSPMQPRCLQMLEDDFVVAADCIKPILHVWPINKQEELNSIRFVMPGKVDALAVTPDNGYLIAGLAETFYIWKLGTGRLLNMVSKHYQAITCIRLTDNGEHFATAGKDGSVLVWNLTLAVAPLGGIGESDKNVPVYAFNDHGLAVTDVHIGHGGIRAFMYTVSMDRCCKVYDLANGTLLLSVVFPVALHSVIADRLEQSVYVGTNDGKVLVFNMTKTPRMKEYHLEENELQAFGTEAADTAITCLALSMNGDQLISGGVDNLVSIWDVASRQLLKTIPQVGAITNLMVRPMNTAQFHPGPNKKKLFSNSLKRMMSTQQDNDDFIPMRISQEYSKAPQFDKPIRFNPELEAKATVDPADVNPGEDVAGDNNEKSEENELVKLRAENALLKNQFKLMRDLQKKRLPPNYQIKKKAHKNQIL